MIVVTHTAVVQVLIHMEWIADPSIWAGLVTLVVIELVLGIDNLVFIAILAEKLPPAQRDRARITGLMLAMVMRLLLLASISWLVTLTKPLIVFHDFSFSARDLIMLFGGLFLLFKATVELNERLEGKDSDNPTQRKGAKFWAVVAQIVVLDAIFSLDSVITAVGMVDHLAVMMAAVVIAISLMLMASKALTRFVNSHPTIVILCLSFLLMIGFSLIAEGFSFIIPKGYLYAAIGFSVMIEALNQLAQFNRRRFLSANMTLRQRTTEAVMNLLSGQKEKAELDADTASLVADQDQHPLFNPQERLMIERVLNLNQRSVSSIMTSRHDIERIDLSAPEEEIRSHFPNIMQQCLEEGYDPTKECIPVVPAQHYFMGGIRVDHESKTSMNRLYAVGETSCNGVHGKNRLASNSLLESMVFAERAAVQIKELLPDTDWEQIMDGSPVDEAKYKDLKGLQQHYKDVVLQEIEAEKKRH